jgi:hypothetical protein
MNTRVFSAAGALALLATVISPAESQTPVELEIAPVAGATLFLTDLPNQFAVHRGSQNDLIIGEGRYDDSFTLGVNAGVRLAERFGIEGFFSWMPTQLNAESGISGPVDLNGFMYGLTFLYHFDFTRFDPFLGIGGGAETFDYDAAGWDRHTDPLAMFVAGANIEVTRRVAVRLEARDCIASFDSHVSGVDSKLENDLMLMAGLSWRLPIR